MATNSSSSSPVVGILSLGEMGTGYASLLMAHNYKVATCSAGRSKYTLKRIQKLGIKAYETDAELVAEVDVLLSIVPPRDATATAVRVLEASRDQTAIKRRNERKAGSLDDKLVYIDCNAISARTTRNIAAFFVAPDDSKDQRPSIEGNSSSVGQQTPSQPSRRFSLTRILSFQSSSAEPAEQAEPPPPPISIAYLDGGIIGAPPALKKPSSTTAVESTANNESSASSSQAVPASKSEWRLPSLVLSGPSISSLLPEHLLTTLNGTPVSPSIGSASTLKCCFASITKGLTALTTISFATASQSHVLPPLLSHLETYSPAIFNTVKGSLPVMPPRAYRWVEEMRQIGSTFATEGGLECGETVFSGVAELYRFVSEDTVLGEERNESRKRGKTVEDVAGAMAEGVRAKRRKASNGNGGAAGGDGGVEVDGGDQKLKLAWRGSWS